MNLPNKLTVSRFALTVVFVLAVLSRGPVNDTLALVFFCAAGITDYLDGRIARRRGLITNFGILMDPLADKVLICTAFIMLLERGRMNPSAPVTVEGWMVVLIVARELTITGLRLLAASKRIVLAAEGYGKHKTVSQIVAIISLLVLDAHVEWWSWLRGLFEWWVPAFTQLALYMTVVLTVTSGALYLWRNRALYLDDM
ncbi:MAG: CDP-diacylglycerol--glycerol-3-phosphate 3-phosphatidyltransferase [Verrucomicrobia bacterium]|jgi:CDP-diacylglycerol--glycerol-3-phosphate 3-phosphatidyltransferase|nr:CDP-diacylglycerol--glycerol-3-phosphate 3-phosphatidyltransferase [Verrucomicrobiota bacterium]OQC68085.1 MAG: CDP-diacylglycerol--glycerol-3-phosphate 3-phosphatidyltransferase [Verrucomicrobia bacterium ADurb.Bin006]MDI9380867.1 CDP-diacylglycerol--glycerol-3-phosphate 3-phosphatidyltransferase [Verrucomicrobiota bacterium]NMD20095.1 CDP-diacylglycerol--glycerol-3-phosphate 3-phosphatidyltransferase [Verrucomicrobiota bacterium]HNU98387.1 CDP-diacylglycerol--glycerol-3-phosphate 3-phospha